MQTRKLTQLDETIGVFKVIKDLGMNTYGDSNRLRRVAILECPYCKKEVEMLVESAKRNKSCGCMKLKFTSDYSTKHGDHKKRLYTIWRSMKSRINNPKTEYEKEKYGKLYYCEEWNDYINFRSWALANGYEDTLQIDRIDNNKGYEPSNCRWVTKQENTQNRLKGRRNKELPKGVSVSGNKFRSKITVNGEVRILGYFKTVESAKNAYNRHILEEGLEEFYPLSE